jgi:hypothetical protein
VSCSEGEVSAPQRDAFRSRAERSEELVLAVAGCVEGAQAGQHWPVLVTVPFPIFRYQNDVVAGVVRCGREHIPDLIAATEREIRPEERSEYSVEM